MTERSILYAPRARPRRPLKTDHMKSCHVEKSVTRVARGGWSKISDASDGRFAWHAMSKRKRFASLRRVECVLVRCLRLEEVNEVGFGTQYWTNQIGPYLIQELGSTIVISTDQECPPLMQLGGKITHNLEKYRLAITVLLVSKQYKQKKMIEIIYVIPTNRGCSEPEFDYPIYYPRSPKTMF